MQIPPCFFLQLTGSSLCSPPQVFAPRNWARGYPGKGTFWGQGITGRTGSHCSTSLSPTHTAPWPQPHPLHVCLFSAAHTARTPLAPASALGGTKCPGDHSAAALLTVSGSSPNPPRCRQVKSVSKVLRERTRTLQRHLCSPLPSPSKYTLLFWS